MKKKIQTKTEEPYRITCSKFIGYSENGSATYELTFNKSLQHTGRYTGIEDGLNAYVKKEKLQDVKSNFWGLWHSLIKLFK